MRETISYIVALLVFFLTSTSIGILFSDSSKNGDTDLGGFIVGMVVGILAAYYIGKWVSDRIIPLNIFVVTPLCFLSVLIYYLYLNISFQQLINNPYFQLYALGVFAAVIVSLFSFLWSKLIERITGEAAIQEQIRKLFKTSSNSIFSSHGVPLALTLYTVFFLTSWVWVLMVLISFLRVTFTFFKVIFRTESEQFKRIKMPLVSNRKLTIEKSWALLTAYAAVLGTTVRKDDLIADLESVAQIHENFEILEALNELEWLAVIAPQIINETVSYFEHEHIVPQEQDC